MWTARLLPRSLAPIKSSVPGEGDVKDIPPIFGPGSLRLSAVQSEPLPPPPGGSPTTLQRPRPSSSGRRQSLITRHTGPISPFFFFASSAKPLPHHHQRALSGSSKQSTSQATIDPTPHTNFFEQFGDSARVPAFVFTDGISGQNEPFLVQALIKICAIPSELGGPRTPWAQPMYEAFGRKR